MKLLVVAPHLSTGGMPQYLLKYLEVYKSQYSQIKVVEFSNFSSDFTVQKDKIKILIGEENLITLGNYNDWEIDYDNYIKTRWRLIDIIKEFQPDVVYMSGTPECYEYKLPPDEIMEEVYKESRGYKIIETCHNNSFDFHDKKYIPDEFMFCSQVHMDRSSHIDIPKKIWEYPIEKHVRPNREEGLRGLGLDPSYLHVLNVGLINSNKNQKYIFQLAKKFKGKKVFFHFIGNSCFVQDSGITMEELILNNCKVWGEVNDVDRFMSCMDIYLFPSKKELNPLTVKEALSWDMEVIASRDENYTNQYEGFFSNFHILEDIDVEGFIDDKIPGEELSHNSLSEYDYNCLKEESKNSVYFKIYDIEEGDVVVDCGACIGTFAREAVKKKIERCYCFEPSKFHFEDLKDNMSDDKVVLVNKAVGDKTERANAFFDIGGERKEEIEFVMFKDYMEELGIDKIDFLKMDTEGYEYSIVFNPENYNWIKNNVNKFVGELHLMWRRFPYSPYGMSHLKQFLEQLQKDFDLSITTCDGIDITHSFLNNYYLTNIKKNSWDYYTEVIFNAKNKNFVKSKVEDSGGDKFLIVSSFYNNTREHILQTFDNVTKQTHKNWLLIVGDDFSDNDCGDILREEVKKINHPNILYYDVQFKRELHLCQNLFRAINYDYFLELDSDDILSDNLLEIYDAHFRKYPNVFSIFCDYEIFTEDGNRERISIVRNGDYDIDDEFYSRVNSSYFGVWEQYHSWNMYGHARCFRKSKRDKFPIVKNCKSSADTFSLFNCLQEGDHLLLPRNLYRLVNREDSDSRAVMTEEEFQNYNTNALLAIGEYSTNKKYGVVDLYDDIWHETSALSYCAVSKSCKDINLITDINDEQLESIRFLYPDKNIVLNDPLKDNMVIVWNKVDMVRRHKILEDLRDNPRSFSIYNFFGDFDISEDEIQSYFKEESVVFFAFLNQYIEQYLYFSYFRHTIIDKVVPEKRVMISFESKSIGDTIAWMPYVEEFRKKHNCKVFLFMFWKKWFEKEYPDIDFVNPGETVQNISGQYKIGWYFPWDKNRNPNDFRIIPLQQTASDILGLDYQEIKPKITVPNKPRVIKDKYVCIGIHSTCQAKYWNYPNGWQIIIDYLREKGYKVVHISKERGTYMGNTPPRKVVDKTGGHAIEDRMVDLKYADMFIGVGSGLSWLSWAIGTPTIMISGFSKPFCEFTSGVERVHNPRICNGCFNDSEITFDPGDWNWCPRGNNFACSKSITPEMVIEKIDKIIESKNDQ